MGTASSEELGMGHWKNFADFINMSDRGFYVWSSFGFVAALIAVELIMLAQRRKSAIQSVKDETQQ
jgi:heme exporter protein CcmD